MKKKLEKENLISLFVVSAGDLESEIQPEQIEIKIPRFYIQADNSYSSFLRKEAKELFSDACSTLFETAIKKVYFEDEKRI